METCIRGLLRVTSFTLNTFTHMHGQFQKEIFLQGQCLGLLRVSLDRVTKQECTSHLIVIHDSAQAIVLITIYDGAYLANLLHAKQ